MRRTISNAIRKPTRSTHGIQSGFLIHILRILINDLQGPIKRLSINCPAVIKIPKPQLLGRLFEPL